MKIIELNTVDYGSTGRIMLDIANVARNNGHEVLTCSTCDYMNLSSKKHFYYSKKNEYWAHYMLGRITGMNGCFSIGATKRLIARIDEFQPEIVHIHNIHGFNVNIKLLFSYLSKKKIKIIWTFHDCWPFTGRCTHFQILDCIKWENGCNNCIYASKRYPQSMIDSTKLMWRIKKKWFTSIEDLTIVTPSKWLSHFVKKSFFKNYPVNVINNGIDLEVFKPTISNFRKKNNCYDKYIVLGVAFDWNERKGLDIFIKLANDLSNGYQIVLVGTDEKIDKQLPSNVISIHRTKDQSELAEIYSAADVFVNPTREEVLGMVNIESLACGTPVICFDTGGCSEIVDETVGTVIEKNDYEGLKTCIEQNRSMKKKLTQKCLKKAYLFDKKDKFDEYIRLYEKWNG